MCSESAGQATMMLGLTPDGFVPKDHPLRRIKPLARLGAGADVALVRRDLRAPRVFTGDRRCRETHESSADPEARLYGRGH